MANEKILLVEDDLDNREIIELYAEREGYQVSTVTSGEDALNIIREYKPDIIILDVMLPGIDGYEVCSMIRRIMDVPILFLSARGDDLDKILALGIGGDDYMTKPYNPALLIAKVKAHLRRSRLNGEKSLGIAEEKRMIEFPNLIINEESCTVQTEHGELSLPAKEFQLLLFLAKHPNRVFSTEQLFHQIWGEFGTSDYRTVMVHISNIRKKIEPDPNHPRYIKTVRGIGYKFTP
ncbi:response regulator transcription factor [Fervidibacillus halotolerans]|uniref:Response regulator transcription factor n=1 Tax=Fervidibacillus halotolerans TaxID=2980027 RepID=A0A9E8M2N8_9BACI|nr:response regulator transcription factor [Fervidibacillus halotolerans]WAA13314.1 response regulator transcription factor [Fervidibacillus halotolerans]